MAGFILTNTRGVAKITTIGNDGSWFVLKVDSDDGMEFIINAKDLDFSPTLGEEIKFDLDLATLRENDEKFRSEML